MSWLFDQAPNVAAVTCKSVVAGAPILLVTHYLDDHSWAFLDGRTVELSDALVVSMKNIIDAHPDIGAIADLSPGWSARRANANSPWVRKIDPFEEEE
jgi:hypothetical protein